MVLRADRYRQTLGMLWTRGFNPTEEQIIEFSGDNYHKFRRLEA